MATATIITSTGPRWGNSAFNSSTASLKVGKSGTSSYYGYVGFPRLNPAWYIQSVKLRMKREDEYSTKVLQFGTNQSSAWDDKGSLQWSKDFSIPSGTGTKEWDLTAYKSILQGYAGTWYLQVRHGSGDNSYCEFTGGTSSSSPRLVIEYEEASLTVPGDQFTIGTATAITVGTAGSGLTHKLSYAIGTASGVIVDAITAGASVSWTPAAALAAQITDAMAGTVTLTLESYLSGVLSSTVAFSYTLNIPATYVPTVSVAAFALSNPSGDTIGIYVQGRSKAVCTISATAPGGVSILEYRLTLAGKTYPSASNAITTDVLTATGALTGTVVVVDSRGQSATLTKTSAVTVQPYSAPMITSFSVARCLSDGTLSNSGTYVKYTIGCLFSALSNLNTRTGSVKYKASGGSYSSDISLTSAMTALGTVFSFTLTGVLGGGAIGAGSYVVSASLTDRYNTGTDEAELASRTIWFDLHSSGEGVAIGKVAETSSLFDVGLDSRFDGVVSLGENGQYGNANLVSNPTLAVDAAGWTLGANVTRDTTKSLNGCFSFKSVQSGLSADAWNGARPATANMISCSLGDVFSVSVYAFLENYALFDKPVCVEFEGFDASNVRVQYGVINSIVPSASHNNKWTRLSGKATVTAATAVKCCIRFYLQRNGTAWFACPKLEKGPLATEFIANVEGDVAFQGAASFAVAPTFASPSAALAALGVRVGTFSLSRSTWAADTNYTYAVTFDTALPAAPTAVLVGFLRSGSGLDAYSTGTTGYTTTGFTFNISRNAARSTATDFTLVYIAI